MDIQKKDTRCTINIPQDLMAELREIRKKQHSTIIGAIRILIDLYKEKRNDRK